MQEALLYNYWEYYCNSGQTIYWENSTLKILDSGILNEHNGPDFRFARFQLNGVIYQGAVEFHIDIEDWYKHKHQYDPAYQDVVLHVVAQPPLKRKTVEHFVSGRYIPTFVIPKPQRAASKQSCIAGEKVSKNETRHILQQLALERLNIKVQSFCKNLKNSSEHALFYRGFLRVLGYPFNKNPFEMLALKIPAHIYEVYKNEPMLLLALYFGCSGFLHGSLNDSYALRLQKLFYQCATILSCSLLDRGQWQMSATRPFNHPHLRIVAWVAFLTSLPTHVPFNFINQLLEQRINYKDIHKKLQALFLLKTQGYWQWHYALEKPLKHQKLHVYLGVNRVNEIISNLVIPLAIAIAIKNKNLGFVSYLQDFYCWMPGRCSYGSLFRKSPWLKEYITIGRSFNTGQALLHLNDVYCSRKQCSECPLKRKKLT